ncbi:MAG: Xaa-Pro aminopeptidase, partial [Gramella sp.]|nr:Xaa-Pro aminopeptidase [Christiangramia sp.]
MKKILIAVLMLTTCMANSQVLAERERSKVTDQILGERFNNLLPELMDRTGIDMWVVISREYNEDPVLRTMLPSTWLNARRRTILVFYRNKDQDKIEKLAIARYNIGDNIESAWDKEKQPDQWQALTEIIRERNPSRIGLNYSDNYGIADGLVKTDFEEFKAALPGEFKDRIVSAEELAVGWIETRTLREMVLYSDLVNVTRNIIEEAFSRKVIQPGVTTTDDVVWWMRQKVTDLGLETWFHPTVDIQRSSEKLVDHIIAFSD